MTDLEEKFNKILLEVIDTSLGTLGESVREALYFHLETKFSISKETLCKDPSTLSNGLERIFGWGAKFIEKVIVERLCRTTGYELSPNWQNCCFAENIQKIKEHFIKNQISKRKSE